ncbi:hypothetical protein Daesc_007567 [Daldinia eschscholtzii]|uniref:Uncharacterized protein n=1 Tax=Daldinia eschscholtzii TaxID=292717 RepID=A0AAX6MEC8_9PEZI
MPQVDRPKGLTLKQINNGTGTIPSGYTALFVATHARTPEDGSSRQQSAQQIAKHKDCVIIFLYVEEAGSFPPEPI